MEEVFVGRDDELATLRVAFDAVSAGHARTVIVEGEAGIGKSTLIERFLAGLEAVDTLEASGDETESHVRFAVADQLLRTRGTGALDAAQHVAVGMDLLELFTATAGERSCVVVVDDAHLVDADTLRALLFAARRLSRTPVLIVLVVRGSADALPEGWRKIARSLALGPLTATQVGTLGARLDVPMTAQAARRLHEHTGGNPLYTRAVLDELPHSGDWLHEPRPLPVPGSYAQLVRRRLGRLGADAVRVLEASATLGVRAPLHAALELAGVDEPLAALDEAVAAALVRVAGPVVEFTHPLTRAAIYDALPPSRRSALNAAASRLVDDPLAALQHRVEAARGPDPSLLADLEAFARGAMARGAWPSAVASFLAASRLSAERGERERLALEAIEALMYSGDGAAARRLAEQTDVSPGPHRDSVWAYLAIFNSDAGTAERLLERAWEHSADDRLSATVAQRRAFVAANRLRSSEAIEWAERAVALAPADTATGRFAAASLAQGLSQAGRRPEAHAVLDFWLDHPGAPRPGSGFVLLALKANFLAAEGDLAAARAAFAASAEASLAEGLLVVAAMSLMGLARVDHLQGAWDDSVVAAARAIALAVECGDRWVVAQAHWAASLVPRDRGDWPVADAHVRATRAEPAGFERDLATAAIAAAELAAAKGRPADVLVALDAMPDADGVADPAYFPWQHLHASARLEDGQLEAAELSLARASARECPLAAARLACVRGRLDAARSRPADAEAAFSEAHVRLEPLGMPYELALVELEHARVKRRAGERRAAATLLLEAHGRFLELGATPALARCEQELAACGLAPSARKTRDYSALTPQELAVARLVVSGMTNREVATELMVSTKTVEYHLSNVYAKLAVRSRSELRARARAEELAL